MSPVSRQERLAIGRAGRRRFLTQLGGALAGATGCRWPERRLLPLDRSSAGVLAGEPRYYATSLELDGAASGLLVKSYDGRPIKVEGHPQHPSSLGGSSAIAQASISQLYDPDRSRTPLCREGPAYRVRTPAEFESFVRRHFGELGSKRGRGLGVLTPPGSSPTRRRLLGEARKAWPEARFYQYESWPRDRELDGSRLVFGQAVRTLYHFERAKIILCLEADPCGPGAGSLAHARMLAKARDPEAGEPARLYVVESAWSLTGSIADERLPLAATSIGALTMALDARVSRHLDPSGRSEPAQQPPVLTQVNAKGFLTRVTEDLVEHPGRSLILVGRQHPPWVHALGHRLNHLLDNVGTTLHYVEEPAAEQPGALESIQMLAGDLGSNRIDTLVVLGNNPVYDAPAELDFARALGKVRMVVHAGLYVDETAEVAHWHVPLAHPLEIWGDLRAHDGTLSLVQPLMEPLYGARSEVELLALLLGQHRANGRELVRATHPELFGDESRWRRALHDGFVPGTALPEIRPQLRPLPELEVTAPAGLELTVSPDCRVYDGRFSNLPLLQELPDPVTNLCWGNAALAAAETLRALGLADGDEVSLSLGGRALKLAVMGVPGHAPGSVRVNLGHGRPSAGHVGGLIRDGVTPVGVNVGSLRTSTAFYFASGLGMVGSGQQGLLVTTQPLLGPKNPERSILSQRVPALVREIGWLDYRKQEPVSARHDPVSLWQPPPEAAGPRWGMAIDLTRCHGCGACVVACQVENNVRTVGPGEVQRGRELSWLRLDRYFTGSGNAWRLGWQPLMCQECERAPCEQVCPVGATLHTREGLNDMTYSRCVGARFCANNCPYKVRRFHYFDQGPIPGSKDYEIERLGLNPEVSVRSRGVMEKCTFCVQRIQRAKLQARQARRHVLDGEIQTACAQACPSGAIVFGDLSDPKSRVAEMTAQARAYALLGHLGTLPRVRYLARVTHRRPG